MKKHIELMIPTSAPYLEFLSLAVIRLLVLLGLKADEALRDGTSTVG